jgi:hypothetical protein
MKATRTEVLLAHRPKPQPDELFSSWLIRIARGQGIKLQTFCNMLWPGQPIWNRDCDRSASDDLVASIAELTGTSPQVARATLLSSFKGVLFSDLNRNGNAKWVMPIGIYHRVRNRFGLQYCPGCLCADEPYFRRSWRLSLFTFCSTHKQRLRDGCPKCSRPIHLHRGEMGDRNRVLPAQPTACCWCGEDLCQALTAEPLAPRVQTQQARHAQLLENGPTPLHGFSTVEYFDTLSHVLRLLASPRPFLRGFRRILAEASGIAAVEAKPHRDAVVYFDYMRVADRARLLESSAWLYEDWPDRFKSICRIAGARPSDLLRDFEEGPRVFLDLVRSACPPRSLRPK